MASITPSVVNCPGETFTEKNGHIRLTITSISDSDAATNKRYIGWKVTIEGYRWVTLHAWHVKLGNTILTESYNNSISEWYVGDIIASGNTTYDNDSDGNLTLNAYLKQLFYYAYNSARWNNSSYYQDTSANLVCSQVLRYANITNQSAAVTLNTATISWSADATCKAVKYYLDDSNTPVNVGSVNASSGTYTITGLTPGSVHTVKTVVQRKDSGLWLDKSAVTALSFTQQSLSNTNTPNNFNLGNSPTASIVTNSNLNYWYCHVYDGATKIAESGNVTNTTSKVIDLTNVTLINNMLARHPNDNEITLTFKYFCVSNSVTYTLTERTCKCIIPSNSYKPIFNTNNISYVVTNSASNNITGSNQKVIKGISNVQVTISPASPQGGANMKSYSATSGNSSGSTTNLSSPVINLNNVTGNAVEVQAIDTRDRSTQVSKAFATFIDYFSPTINPGASCVRRNGVEANLVVNITGNYCNWSGLSTTNVITQVSLKYKLKSASTYSTISGVNLTITNNSGNFTITGTITGDLFNTTNEYDVLLTFKDKLTEFSQYFSIPTGSALLWRDIANKRIGIGKKPTKTLDVNGDINATNIYKNGTALATVATSGSYNDLSNKPTLGASASKGVKTLSAVGNVGWTDQTDGDAYVISKAFMAYWNGRYNSSSSNLAYCNKGAFGDACIKGVSSSVANSTNLITAQAVYNYLNNKSVATIISKNQYHDGQQWSNVTIKTNSSKTKGDGFTIGTNRIIAKRAMKVLISAQLSIYGYSYSGDINIYHRNSSGTVKTHIEARGHDGCGYTSQTAAPFLITDVAANDYFEFSHYTGSNGSSGAFTTSNVDNATYLTVQEL